MMHLHSCFQIKAKNYDKVEKVRAKNTCKSFQVELGHIVHAQMVKLAAETYTGRSRLGNTPPADSSRVDFQS